MAEHVLQGAGHEEILLFETQSLALDGFVVGVEDLGDVLRLHLAFNGAVVVALVEGCEIERLDSLGLEEPEVVASVDVVAGDGRVVGDADDGTLGKPADAEAAVAVGGGFGVVRRSARG